MACVIMSCLSFPENKIGIMFIPYGFEANDVSHSKFKKFKIFF